MTNVWSPLVRGWPKPGLPCKEEFGWKPNNLLSLWRWACLRSPLPQGLRIKYIQQWKESYKNQIKKYVVIWQQTLIGTPHTWLKWKSGIRCLLYTERHLPLWRDEEVQDPGLHELCHSGQCHLARHNVCRSEADSGQGKDTDVGERTGTL